MGPVVERVFPQFQHIVFHIIGLDIIKKCLMMHIFAFKIFFLDTEKYPTLESNRG